jgi:hypothetical protein
MVPRGNLGENNFPSARLTTARIYLNNVTHLVRETDRLSKTYVVDAWFITSHYLPKINRDLSRSLPRNTKFQLSHLSGYYYMLMFDSHITRHDFMSVWPAPEQARLCLLYVDSDDENKRTPVWIQSMDWTIRFTTTYLISPRDCYHCLLFWSGASTYSPFIGLFIWEAMTLRSNWWPIQSVMQLFTSENLEN